MKFIILSLCLATASAAPSIFHYLPHYAGSRGQMPPSQVRNPFTAGQSLPQIPGLSGLPGLPDLPGAYSVELIYPHRFAGGAGGSAQPFPTHGFIKYSIPQPPGRQSVEVYYPYDFSQQRIMTNMPPMTNVPQMPNMMPFDHPLQNNPQPNPNVMPYDYPLQNNPQPNPNVPSFDASPPPSQVPQQPFQQDQPAQTSQMPAKV